MAHLYGCARPAHIENGGSLSGHPTDAGLSIGERRQPDPQGRPGYLRVDTVHQGDQDGVKGVYHINAVDEVTQWEVVGAVEQISEAWLLPVLEAMLAQFPFPIRGFHSDNGSEFINHTVAKLLNKLLIEQTKSRPRHCNDNGLAEAKNGAVVRKHMGYGHIAAAHAEAIKTFYRNHFNPYLNFHRPCGVPEVVTGAKGKQRRTLSMVRDAVGDSAATARPGAVPETRLDRGTAQPKSRKGKRTAERHDECRKKNRNYSPLSGEGKRHDDMAKRAVEMTGYGKRGKPKSGFPPSPTALGNRQRRDSHIPTAPATNSEKWKSKSRIPTFPPARFIFNKNKEAWTRSLRSPPRLILYENQNCFPGSFFGENMLPRPEVTVHRRIPKEIAAEWQWRPLVSEQSAAVEEPCV